MTEQNKMETESQPAQKELDLEFNQMEPITPKKPIVSEPTLLSKAKGFMSAFGKKAPAETQFNVRKEPTFSDVSGSIEPSLSAQSAESPTSHILDNQEQQLENVINQEQQVENVIIAEKEELHTEQPATSPVAALKNPEKWAILQTLPPKYRRIFIALLIAILLLILISWLKPSEETVQSFEQNPGHSIPTQFQSIDQTKPVEPTGLEQLNNSPAPAEEITTAGQPESMTAESQAAVQMPTEPSVSPSQSEQPQTMSPAQTTETETLKPQAMPERNLVKDKPQTVEPVKPVQPVQKEQPKPVEKAKPAEKAKIIEKTKTVEKPKLVEKSKGNEKGVSKQADKRGGAPVVEAKPAGASKTTVNKTAATTTAETVKQSTVSRKTLTVPQGVSLMQVFRENQLQISDVNAMTKASGAGNALSSFKPGDKVQVSLNSQGRVNELRLSNGARFIRQPDGTYQYKK